MRTQSIRFPEIEPVTIPKHHSVTHLVDGALAPDFLNFDRQIMSLIQRYSPVGVGRCPRKSFRLCRNLVNGQLLGLPPLGKGHYRDLGIGFTRLRGPQSR
jgi:hypothetical protein